MHTRFAANEMCSQRPRNEKKKKMWQWSIYREKYHHKYVADMAYFCRLKKYNVK
jgi:hypothetical protein